jgi:hypothetical protein
MDLVSRAKNIVLSPKTEWEVIAAEESSVKSIYLEYLVVLAAIPAVAAFIGMSLIGISVFGMQVRVPFISGIVQLVLSYGLSLLGIYLLGLVIDALASSFQAQKNPLNAFKLAAYSMTPSMLAGVLSILPALSPLALLAGLYGIYVLFLGIPTLMKAPQDKAIPYTAVAVVCAIVINLVVGGIAGIAVRTGAMGSGVHVGEMYPLPQSNTAPAISINTPQGKIQIDTQKLEAMNKKIEDLNKQMEAAQKSGDQAAATQAAMQVISTAGSAFSAQSETAGK